MWAAKPAAMLWQIEHITFVYAELYAVRCIRCIYQRVRRVSTDSFLYRDYACVRVPSRYECCWHAWVMQSIAAMYHRCKRIVCGSV